MKYILIILVLAIVGVGAAYQLGMRVGEDRAAQTGTTTEADDAEKAPAVWTCAMHPQVRLPKPGKCPICFMDLIELVEDAGSGGAPRRLVMTEAGKSLAEIETVSVERRHVVRELRVIGLVDYDETRVSHITAWVYGRLERLFVDYTGVPVKEGDHMVVLYSPDLLTAQRELQQAWKRQRQKPGDRFSEISLKAAREKLRLWGIREDQIQEIEQGEVASDRITIYAPSGGIVVEKMGFDGMWVDVGSRIYTIADLTELWVQLDAYESDVQWLRLGQEVEFESESWPGEAFKGRIAFIQPTLHKQTRSVKVRVNVNNQDGRLKPGMFVRAIIRAKLGEGGVVADSWLSGKWVCPMHPDVVAEGPGDCSVCGMPLATAESLGYADESVESRPPLVVPVTAPLVTGTRAIVYVEVLGAERPTYEGRVVTLGPRAGNDYIVRSGLDEGERVVVEGAFKIDSALQIKARPSMMSAEEKAPDDATDLHPLDVPRVFREQLGAVIRVYLDLQERLAADDSSGSADLARELQREFERVDMVTLDAEAHVAWMADLQLVRRGVDEMRAADGEIEAQRRAFLLLSEAVPILLRRYHPVIQQALHEFRCPMAFNNRGAAWLQRSESLSNPYFGSAMLRCGEKTDLFPMPADEPAVPEALPADHDHTKHQASKPSSDGLDQFREQLGAVVDAYLDLQESLASDDQAGSLAAVAGMREALALVDMANLSGKSHDIWMKELRLLTTALAQVSDASPDLDTLRIMFREVSNLLPGWFDRHLSEDGGELHRFFCPMAFDDVGADWYQRTTELSNPYFGARMLRCGTPYEKRDR